MDTSVFALDLSAWLSWTADFLYVASICLALFVVVLVSCIVAQNVTAAGPADASKRRAHLAH